MAKRWRTERSILSDHADLQHNVASEEDPISPGSLLYDDWREDKKITPKTNEKETKKD